MKIPFEKFYEAVSRAIATYFSIPPVQLRTIHPAEFSPTNRTPRRLIIKLREHEIWKKNCLKLSTFYHTFYYLLFLKVVFISEKSQQFCSINWCFTDDVVHNYFSGVWLCYLRQRAIHRHLSVPSSWQYARYSHDGPGQLRQTNCQWRENAKVCLIKKLIKSNVMKCLHEIVKKRTNFDLKFLEIFNCPSEIIE